MNIRRLIKVLFVISLFLSAVAVAEESDESVYVKSILKTLPEDESLVTNVAKILQTLPRENYSTREDLISVYVDQWDRYRESIRYLLELHFNPLSEGKIMSDYLKHLSEPNWAKDGYPWVTRFIERTKGDKECAWARDRAVETLIYRGTPDQIAAYLPDDGARSMILDHFKDTATSDALRVLEYYVSTIPKKSNDKFEKIESVRTHVKEAISIMKEKQVYADKPIAQIPTDYFARESKQQYEKICGMIAGCSRIDPYGSNYKGDGSDYIRKYWTSYRLGAHYFIENVDSPSLFSDFISCILCGIDTDEATEMLHNLVYHRTPHQNQIINDYLELRIIRCYICRIDIGQINSDFSKYLYDYSLDLSPHIVSTFVSRGNQESLSILKAVRKFWYEKGGLDHFVKDLDKAILSIEERLGITPILHDPTSAQTEK
jgi:hypothetical protein